MVYIDVMIRRTTLFVERLPLAAGIGPPWRKERAVQIAGSFKSGSDAFRSALLFERTYINNLPLLSFPFHFSDPGLLTH